MKRSEQLQFKKVNGWGGKRKRAGRKNESGAPNHMPREKIDLKKPLHITMRLRDNLKSIRTSELQKHFQVSLAGAKDRGLFVNHFSIQDNHVHVFAEAKDNEALGKAMKSLGCRFGKAVRKHCGGRGPVFKGRFHVHILKTPSEVKNGLAYVLLNQSKHRNFIPYKDKYSSAAYFHDWKLLLGKNIGPILADWERIEKPLPDYLSRPKSWLAREGWKRACR